LINTLQLKTVILLGDVFHSELNSDWFDLIEFLQINYQIQFILPKEITIFCPTHFIKLRIWKS
jgi:hypothetical protein